MMASTFAFAPVTIWPNGELSVALAMDVVAAPSCTSSTMTSASPLLSSPSLSSSATRFTSGTTGLTSRVAMPAGLTRLGSSSVIAPMNPTVTPSKSCR